MSRGLYVVLATMMLDAIGIGIVMPILPGLLRALGREGDVANEYGLLVTLYALMQFLFAPLLGLLSDRFGRRPILLISLAGAAVDYLVMATTPYLWVIYAGRAIAGVTGANMAVANAYIADITDETNRAQRFGLLSAAFGVGFIIGPALGGWLGADSLRAPFVAAALLNGVNFLVGLFLLPEPARVRSTVVAWRDANPFRAMHSALRGPVLGPLLVVFGLMAMVGTVGHVMWVISNQDRFGWDLQTIGLSLTAFGALHAIAQAFVAGPAVKRLGERGAFVMSCIFDGLAYIVIGVTGQGWVVLAMIPLLCLGGIGQPAVQALLSNSVSEDRQGELQGLIAALTSIAVIVSPLVFTTIYAWTTPALPGAVWLIGAALYVPCVALLLRTKAQAPISSPAST
ncbi:TCR/Tet family MFS transporter [Roseiterribacter gracilis]|uniref:Tetracycline efflux MFS transporter Tet(A) n=1 Tax=Roseiterribacter gracilis TaxID=2812848 RepID=A0A8S8XFH1_9PROT|nr:tetracycline efflux MFS transporter Tet(A) [Rhodospirillales bacterium TMPK1]